jgi:hypothetical protein
MFYLESKKLYLQPQKIGKYGEVAQLVRASDS